MPSPCMYSLNTLDTISKEVRAKAPRPKKSAAATVPETTSAVAGSTSESTVVTTVVTTVQEAGTANTIPAGVSDDIQQALNGI